VQTRGRMTEVELLSDGDEIPQVAKLDIHMHRLLIKTNGILDVLVRKDDTALMDLLIRPLRDDADAAAFRALNEEWIARSFAVEPQDRRQLDDPVAAYIDTGGEILIAELDGRAVGCVALVPDGTGAYELSKMAVAPELRGRGAGRTLLSAAIDHARELGATSLFLGSSRKLANAVHLYEALGFQHVAPETLHMPYARADVFMQLVFAAPQPPAEIAAQQA
jgi:putative acetyltransferase